MKGLRVILLLSLLLLLLAACGQGAEEAVVDEGIDVAAVAETASPPTETAVPPTETLAPTATVLPTETAVPPTETPAPTATAEALASACVTCHSDQEMLINTTAPVEDEPEEAESSGVG